MNVTIELLLAFRALTGKQRMFHEMPMEYVKANMEAAAKQLAAKQPTQEADDLLALMETASRTQTNAKVQAGTEAGWVICAGLSGVCQCLGLPAGRIAAEDFLTGL